MKTIFHFHLITASSVLLAVDSCKSKKEGTATSPAAYTQQQTTTSSPATQPQNTSPASSSTAQSATPPVSQSTNLSKDDNVRFIVSFYSMGAGIDVKIKDEFVKFMNSYPKKIAYEPKHWGREGEIDYCLALAELSAGEQMEFVKKANEILSKSKIVHQKENSICEHAGRSITATVPEEEIYPLVVSFFSIASGIDLKVHGEFEKFLSTYPKKIAFEPTHWGREGEIDYCLKLSELSTAEQTNFVKKAKDLLSKSTLVYVNENAKCVHKH